MNIFDVKLTKKKNSATAGLYACTSRAKEQIFTKLGTKPFFFKGYLLIGAVYLTHLLQRQDVIKKIMKGIDSH